jgi:mRNA-degrading endonuclease RelE of RelBE toxin-antitoxin system
MKVIQSPLFARKVKKLHKDQKIELDNVIKKILEDPRIGEGKKGDLKDLFIYKFKIKTTQYLLAYRLREKILELITIGPHENYYRDLKIYLKSQK